MKQAGCDICGLEQTKSGFVLIEPSDAHDVGGHYTTVYNASGMFRYTDKPWQAGEPVQQLGRDEMVDARRKNGGTK